MRCYPDYKHPRRNDELLRDFQRALLDEQLRLAAKVANNKRVGGDDVKEFLADNEEEVSLCT